MNKEFDHVTMIDALSVKVVNPRSRNKFKHFEITESIKNGLRKPITVRRIKDEDYQYALICGQGRLESFHQLKEKMIPAFIIDVDEETAYLMSLIENMARVNPRTGEQFYRIRDMTNEGMANKDISKHTGLSVNWINSIIMLLGKGENKLLAAVESGKIPISLAVEIAKSNYKESQELFIEAFEAGKIKQRDVIKLRKILETRSEGLKGSISNSFKSDHKKKKISVDELTKMYQDSINEHKSLKNKARLIEENILLAQQIFMELLKDESFSNLVKQEQLSEAVILIQKPHREYQL